MFLVMSENGFRARDIGLRAQKKILSRMSNKTVAKTFIDGTTASLLDNIYRLAKIHVSFYLPPEHLLISLEVHNKLSTSSTANKLRYFVKLP